MKKKNNQNAAQEETAVTAVVKTDENKNAKDANFSQGMSIYEYEQKFSKRENVKRAKACIRLLAATIGIFLLVCLVIFTMKVWEIHMYAGIGAGVVCLLLYIVFFLVPLFKILKADSFVVNVNAMTARKAQKHNRKLRHDISDKIIDFTSKVEGVGWYDSAVVGALAISLKAGDENAIKRNLTLLYTGSVKKTAKDMIFKTSMKSAMYSVLSKTNKVDAVLSAFVNLQLIKDLVFLYGFRPSDTKLVKIFARVLQNSLVAYGLGGAKIGNSIVHSMGGVIKGIPILGTAISSLIDSSIQGLTNGVLTAVIGFQTIKYLSEEYRLQDILDGVRLEESEEELRETCAEIEKELKGRKAPSAA